MPYIKQTTRADAETTLASPGELNFCITRLLHNYEREHGRRYQTMNDMVAAVEAAKLRRQGASFIDNVSRVRGLTSAILVLCSAYVRIHRGSIQLGNDFQAESDILGVLECAKLELYRRHIAPYENEKMVENGDVE